MINETGGDEVQHQTGIAVSQLGDQCIFQRVPRVQRPIMGRPVKVACINQMKDLMKDVPRSLYPCRVSM